MANWQKISLRDAVGKVVFDDEWGFIKFDGNVSYSIGGRNISDYYIENADGDKERLSISENNKRDLMSLFSKILYYRNQNYGYYGRSQEQYLKVEVEEVTVIINQSNRYGYNNDSLSRQREFVIKKQDKKRLEYLRYVWICDEIQDEKFNPDKYFKQPLFKDLKVDDELLYDGKKFKIVLRYEQPNENGNVFVAVPSYDYAVCTPVYVTFNDKIYVLPYIEQPVSETEKFNTFNNEFELSPYAVKTGQLLNVYWNMLDDAAEYIVSLYKKFDRPYLQKIYHLKDYIADRNDGYISIDGLADEGYIVTVKAENRNGEQIALSRGISISGNKQCVPQYWKE